MTAAEQIAASWPPLTREQANTVNHIISPAPSGLFSCPKAA